MPAIFAYIPLGPALRVYVATSGAAGVGGWLGEAEQQVLRDAEHYGYVVRFLNGIRVTCQAERVRPTYDLITMFGLHTLLPAPEAPKP